MAIEPGVRTQANEALVQHALDWLQDWKLHHPTTSVPSIALYRAFRGEVNVLPLADRLRSAGWATWFPITLVERHELRFVRVTDETMWKSGAYGIWEPEESALETTVSSDFGTTALSGESPPAFDFIFLPGLAFDDHGGRLGYGGGYYDRFLARLDSSVRLVGVGFENQRLPSVPVEPHDQRLHYIVTEEGVTVCR